MIKRLFVLLLLAIVAAAAFFYYAIATPYAAYGNETFVEIPSGTSIRGIGRILAKAGVVRSEYHFLLARALNQQATLQAGEYRFDRPMTVLSVFDKIARGDTYHIALRIPEGANMFDIAAELEKLGLMKHDEFLKAARDPALIRDLAPGAPSLEGYLFPSTYRISPRANAQQVAREMTNQFRRVWKQLEATGEDINSIVTLASLVEKETGVPAERTTVASVYQNRLRTGMRLDCDPTTIYAALLEDRWDGVLHRSDLDSPHPYNTYRNRGLPPGPIANPGLESLRAALKPADTNYLFFVAKGDGSGAHVFTESIDEHNAAVRDYRRAIAQ